MKLFRNLLILISLLSMQNLIAQSRAYESVISAKQGTLTVNYFSNSPMLSQDGESMKGIEYDILLEFKNWMQENKGIAIDYKFEAFDEFETMYNRIKDSQGNMIGAGTIAISSKREGEVDFSAPYLKNVSILVSSGNVKTARTEVELKNLLRESQAYTVKGSIHEEHLLQLYKKYTVEPNIKYLKEPEEVLAKLKESPRNIGYVDVITFWKYLKENKQYIKMHSVANYKNENFGFIFPKGSGWANEFNEFLESGFGFTATKKYHQILEKHLSYEILNSVELNP